MSKRIVEVFLDEYVNVDPTVRGYNLYISRYRQVKGKCIFHFCKNNLARLILDSGEWYARVLAVNAWGEDDWRAVEPVLWSIGVPAAPVSALKNPGLNVVRPQSGLRVSFDPPDQDEDRQYVEVLEGPDEDRAKLVAVLPVLSFDAPEDVTMAPRLPAGVIPVGGVERSATRKVILRPVSYGGKRGTSTTVDLPVPHVPDSVVEVLFEIDGATNTGFVAPTSTDAFELDATDGLRLRALPLWNLLAANWGVWDDPAGLFGGEIYGSNYLRSGTLVSTVHDFGIKTEFQLSILDQFQRKSGTAAGPISWDQDCWPAWPGLEAGPERFTVHRGFWRREILTWDEKPLFPQPQPRWEYELDESGTYLPYDHEAVLVANKVRVRCHLYEPSGFFQLISPKVVVQAVHRRFRWEKNETYTGGSSTQDFNAIDHPVTGKSPWTNEMIVKVTPYTTGIIAAVVLRDGNPVSGPPSYRVAMIEESTGAAPAGNVDFAVEVSGY